MSARLLLLPLLLALGCGRPPAPPSFDVPADVGQVVLVTPVPPSAAGAVSAEVRGFERRGDGWHEAFSPMRGVVGRNGVIAADRKREGDGHTPAGTYPLGPAFGYAERIDTKLDYRRVTDADLWVDDPDHPDYNRWVPAPTAARSFEKMKRDDDLYELGAVIGYNTAPVVPGRGSAIFLHVWGGPAAPTAGCVAVSRGDLAGLLRWLDRTRNPAAVIRPGG
jgi:L,D-peptidoglycan transpeptidase YkuD (ErfK/YbiS/YcfS/YnhG family)